MHRRTHGTLATALAFLLLLGAAHDAEARPTQGQIDQTKDQLSRELSEVAAGLETGLRKNDVAVAERLYSIEMRSLKLLEQASRTRYARPEKHGDVLANVRGLIARTLQLQERVLDHTIAELDRALPGEPDRMLLSRLGRDQYRPLFRADTPAGGSSGSEGRRALREMRSEFRQRGGARTDIVELDASFLSNAASGRLYEWTHYEIRRQNGKVESYIKLTDAGAKHPVIADGRTVLGAGSLKVYRGKNQEILLTVISNSSGNYKPGPGSTEAVVDRFADLGIRAGRVLTTRVQPAEPTLVKLLMKSKKEFTKAQIQAHARGLVSRVEAERSGRAARVRNQLKDTSGSRDRVVATRDRARTHAARPKPPRPPTGARVRAARARK
jgi:hypothetical protein